MSYLHLIYTRTDTQADPTGAFHIKLKGDHYLSVAHGHGPPQMSRVGKKFDRVFVYSEWCSRTDTKTTLKQIDGQN